MGRGRQKAKATKQARDMKYFSPATDLSALERELAGSRGSSRDDDQYIAYADKYTDVENTEEDDDPRYAG
ncbi:MULTISPECIES: DUF3073 domain-containing protein [Micrococcaceae]|jgi:hypothetical protein|uniref:DUF3073 domain-containing protein n=1 Tax=Micrococcaceae TaxID=1268 RepID=UPI0003040270|nr:MULTISPECIES: DUF3073 domain-containing protein [Micrococcaceae]HRO29297.1 DUF3073 domain-containing protein [Citricoccus sp.]HRO92670.1 DUF3073 domain-containing protein [Citricoccus sp.]